LFTTVWTVGAVAGLEVLREAGSTTEGEGWDSRRESSQKTRKTGFLFNLWLRPEIDEGWVSVDGLMAEAGNGERV
jgi:hypothetical protein